VERRVLVWYAAVEEKQMNPDYVFLCGVMWAQYASEDARCELVRAVRCGDPDVALLANAILQKRLPPPSMWSGR